MREKFTKQRIERMLEQDMEDMNEASRGAALQAFLHVAEEYFDVEGQPSFFVKKGKGRIGVSSSLTRVTMYISDRWLVSTFTTMTS